MSPRRHASHIGIAVLAGLIVTLLAPGCGSADPPDPAAPESSAPQQARGTGSQAQEGQQPARAPVARLFSPQLPPLHPDFEAIARGVNPADPSDPWPGEFLALSAEAVLEDVARLLARGEGPERLQRVTTRDLSGSVDGEPIAAGPLLAELVRELRLEGHSEDDLAVEVDVLEVEAPPLDAPQDGRAPVGRTVARIRAGTRPESARPGPREQVDVTWDVEWRLGKRARIASIDVRSRARRALDPPFRDVTETILDAPGLGDILDLGALEAVGRTDRLAPFPDVQLAMHGCAVGDLDGDGRDDLFVGRAAGQPNLAFRDEGGVFRECGAQIELDLLEDTGGTLIVDLDGDGARDVAMGMGGDVLIAWNDGSGSFGERTRLRGPTAARVYSLAAADPDGDGDLDLYDTRYFRSGGYGAQAPLPYHDATNGAANVFWRNRLVDGQSPATRAFRDDTSAIGLDAENDRFSLVATFDDFDEDGDLDLYVANDFGRNSLYVWEGDRFRPATEGAGLVDKAAGMGISVADADLDGRPDLVVSNMYSSAGMRVTRDPRFRAGRDAETCLEFMRHARGNSLFRGVGPGRFEDVTDATAAAPGGWAWGARFVDWDRDGLPDLVVPNGFLSGRRGPDLASFFWRRVVGASPSDAAAEAAELDRYLGAWAVISHLSQLERQDWNARERTYSYGNRGGLRFDDVTLASGLGFADDGRALVCSDLDGDGRLDLVFRNRTSPILRVMQGTPQEGHWLALRLAGDPPNADAVGALVTVTVSGVVRRARITAGDGFLGGSTLEVHFGLGEADSIDALEVTWPDGASSSYQVTGPEGDSLVDGAWTLRRGASVAELRHRGKALQLPGELRAPRPAATPGPPRARVPLFDEVPLGAWRLPTFDAGFARVDELAGASGLVVVVWAHAVPASLPGLQAAGARSAELEPSGLRFHPLSLDAVRGAEEAERVARATSPGAPGGRAGRAASTIVELVLAATLAPYDDLPLPIALLFDAEGDLGCLYVGDVDVDAIARDARVLAQRADPSALAGLTGGRWASAPPKRDLERFADVLARSGLDELAEHVRSSRR
ncbi:MAG: CRTAC1 family protein [Planctomycetota bacterium]